MLRLVGGDLAKARGRFGGRAWARLRGAGDLARAGLAMRQGGVAAGGGDDGDGDGMVEGRKEGGEAKAEGGGICIFGGCVSRTAR